MSNSAYIQMKGITKVFGKVLANNNIDFDVKKGEIHALLGENGSGKSTLVNMLAGIYSQDKGEIYVNGKKQSFKSPSQSISLGIGMIHQHFKLVDILTAKQNITLGQHRNLFIKNKKLNDKIYDIEKKYGLIVNPDKKVYEMSVGEKQTVEIIKVIYRGADVLILDEPTAVLTPQEIKILFEILKNMKKEGCAIIIITHKMNEVMEISDRVTVLRKGESIATVETNKTTSDELISMMVGKKMSIEIAREDIDIEKMQAENEPILEVSGLTVKDNDGVSLINDLKFNLYGGEILGVAGIAGSGQKELCEVIAGLIKADSGKILFNKENIIGKTPKDIIKKGISMSFIPEDRLGMGLVGGMDVVDNVMLKSYQNTKGIFMDFKEGRKKAEQIVSEYSINTPSINHQVKKLSGGNIQKVLLGREISLNPHLLITAYPVRGLDIGASYNIYDILLKQKKNGVGILFIGEDLDVLLGICDRLMVISNGKIMDIVDPKKVTKEDVGFLMLGESIKNKREDAK